MNYLPSLHTFEEVSLYFGYLPFHYYRLYHMQNKPYFASTSMYPNYSRSACNLTHFLQAPALVAAALLL